MDTRTSSAIAFGKAIGSLILLFIAVYVPTFAIAGSVSRSMAVIVPLTIVISLGIALGLIAFFIRRPGMSVAAFGLRFCPPRYVLFALIVGLALGVGVAWCTGRAHEPGPLAGLSLSIGISILYFGIGAPIQEEVIFRGLLQSVLTRSFVAREASAHSALLLVAVLFGVIHLVVGPVTAVCALLLGVVAGELRLRSGSLIPAVIVHALFNLCGMFWPQV